jgi:hypothetical protein
MGQYGQLFSIITLIIGLRGGQPLQTATGFFYTSHDKVYLVTNRHVVINESENYYPDTLRLRLHLASLDITKSENYDVPLVRNGKPTWHIDPNFASSGIDIAVVELDKDSLTKGHALKWISKDLFLPSNYVLAPGEELMVLGFPRGFSDQLNNLGVARNASIASAYGVNYEGKPLFLVDANLHPGTSGSPVFTKVKSTWNDAAGNTNMDTKCFFLGINSASLSSVLQNGNEPLGLSVIWYAKNIEDIINSITPDATNYK